MQYNPNPEDETVDAKYEINHDGDNETEEFDPTLGTDEDDDLEDDDDSDEEEDVDLDSEVSDEDEDDDLDIELDDDDLDDVEDYAHYGPDE